MVGKRRICGRKLLAEALAIGVDGLGPHIKGLAFRAFNNGPDPVVETGIGSLQIVKDVSALGIDYKRFFRSSGSEWRLRAGALKACVNLAFLF